jgi:hypothetical protein
MFRIVVKGHRDAPYKEAPCLDAGGILPGHLVDYDTSGNVHRTTRQGPVSIRIAVENNIFSGTGGWTANQITGTPSYLATPQPIVPTPYLTGDEVIMQELDFGDEAFGWVNSGNTAISINDFLESAGDGTIRKSAAPGVQASLQLASATSLTTGITLTAKQGGAAGNQYGIIVSAPSGGGSVNVVDGIVTVVPAAASTIAQLVTQLNASANFSNIMTATSTDGVGASSAQASALAYLANGLDGGQETAKMRAMQALTNTSGSPQMLRYEVL